MGLTYAKAGVNIDEGNRFVSQIKPLVKKTRIPGTIGSIGGFAGLFDPDFKKYKKPLLVSATDGVGTKLELAQSLKIHDTVGIDLVAMSVNDLVVTLAEWTPDPYIIHHILFVCKDQVEGVGSLRASEVCWLKDVLVPETVIHNLQEHRYTVS